MKFLILLFVVCVIYQAPAQTYLNVLHSADSAYIQKSFVAAGLDYIAAAKRAYFNVERRGAYWGGPVWPDTLLMRV